MTGSKSNIKPKDFYVYLHRKATNGKVFYVGKGHGKRAWDSTNGRNRHWRSVVAKHGFTVEIYKTGLLEWYAFELEIETILRYGRDNLANVTDGGEGPSGAIQSKERIAKTIALHTGSKRSKESRKTMKAAQAFKMKIVYCSNGMVFNGYPDCVAWLKSIGHKTSSAASICDCCKRNGNRAGCYGFQWSFTNDFSELEKLKPRHMGAVLCSNGMQFESKRKAVDWLRASTYPKAEITKISGVCSGKRKNAYGHQWSYA